MNRFVIHTLLRFSFSSFEHYNQSTNKEYIVRILFDKTGSILAQ